MIRLAPLPVALALLVGAALLPGTAGAASAKPAALPEKQIEAIVDLKRPGGLNRFVRRVSDPGSRHYRRYASIERLIARFGAEPRTKRRVLAWFAARGVEARLDRTGSFVAASLSARRAARIFGGGAGATASAAAVAPAIPAGLRGAVRAISVVDAERTVTRNAASPAAASALATTSATGRTPYFSPLPHSGTSRGCAAGSSGGEPGLPPFTPNQYLTAYGHAAMHARGLKGQGQTVAVVETGGFKRSDVEAFARCFGVEAPPTRAIPVGGGKPLPAEDETTLDLEMLSVGAPGLDRILVYEGSSSLIGIVVTAASALGDRGHRPDVISISLGFCEPQMRGSLALRNAIDAVFAFAAGAGISVLVSAGDQGSSGCRVEPEGEITALPVLAVSLPASSPYATAVGGTNLELSAKNRIKREIVWNDSPKIPWGGGGGGSIISPRTPWWQGASKRYGPGRKVPDIAALADIVPGYAFYCTAVPCRSGAEAVPGWLRVGGTSAAAPLTAAGVALANQHAERRGQRTLGFLNPLLYDLGSSKKKRRGAFNDVTVGNNDIGRALPPAAGGGRALGCCSATAGYDWASGWGSVKVVGLAKLAAAAARQR